MQKIPQQKYLAENTTEKKNHLYSAILQAEETKLTCALGKGIALA